MISANFVSSFCKYKVSGLILSKRMFNNINISSSIESIIGYTHAELLNQNPLDLIHPDDIEGVKSAFMESLLKPNNPVKAHFRFRKANGDYIWLETVGLNFLSEGSENDTENIEMDKGCVNEKNDNNTHDEVHRKVSGTLQLILSLLKLQSNFTYDSTIKKQILFEHARIKAISLICNLSYRSADKSRINMEEYLYDLATNLFVAFDSSKRNTSIKISAFDINFNLDTAVPFGLIVNELLLNSFKRKVFRERVIDIKLYKSFNDTFTLEYSDSSMGYGAQVSGSDFSAFEMRLIDILAKQIDGRIFLNTIEGLVFKIGFRCINQPVKLNL